MQWLLHVGTTKTGSKAIQQFLATDAETLDRHRIVFPKTGRGGGIWHEELYASIEAGRFDMLEAARDEALLAQADYAVLSYEGFYQLPPESIRLIRDVLGAARIVLFIRRQDSHANSWYNQLIKAQRVTIAAIEEFERNVSLYHPMFDHSLAIEKWSSVFGAGAMHPVLYDKSSSSVDLLLEALEVRVPARRRPSPNPNRALTPTLAATLRGVKELIGDAPGLPEIVDLFHQEHWSEFLDTYSQGTVYMLRPSVRTAIMDNYLSSNEWVRRWHFPQRETLFAPPPEGAEASLDIEWGREEARRFLRTISRLA